MFITTGCRLLLSPWDTNLAYRYCKKYPLDEDQPKQCQWEKEVAGVQLWLCFCRLITLPSQLLYRLIRRKPLHP